MIVQVFNNSPLRGCLLSSSNHPMKLKACRIFSGEKWFPPRQVCSEGAKSCRNGASVESCNIMNGEAKTTSTAILKWLLYIKLHQQEMVAKSKAMGCLIDLFLPNSAITDCSHTPDMEDENKTDSAGWEVKATSWKFVFAMTALL